MRTKLPFAVSVRSATPAKAHHPRRSGRPCADRAYQRVKYLAPNIVWLAPLTNLTTKARLRDLDEAGFGIAELVLLDNPADWPQSGFQLVAAWLRKGHPGSWAVTRLAR